MNVSAPKTTLCPEFGSPGAEPLSWEYARSVLAEAPLYRITTVRPDGRPHSTPLLGVWADESGCFCTGPRERKALNLSENPHCLLSIGDSALDGPPDIVVEGTATRVEGPEALDRIARTYEEKYGSAITAPEGTWFGLVDSIRRTRVPTFRVAPKRAFAFGKAPMFSQTRYTF